MDARQAFVFLVGMGVGVLLALGYCPSLSRPSLAGGAVAGGNPPSVPAVAAVAQPALQRPAAEQRPQPTAHGPGANSSDEGTQSPTTGTSSVPALAATSAASSPTVASPGLPAAVPASTVTAGSTSTSPATSEAAPPQAALAAPAEGEPLASTRPRGVQDCAAAGQPPAVPKVDPSTTGAAVCDGIEAWARTFVSEQLAPWAHSGITTAMHQRSLNFERLGSYQIEVKGGQVSGDDSGFAEYMARAAAAWPFPREELRDFKTVSTHADWPFLVKGELGTEPAVCGPALTNANNGKFWEVLMPVQSRPQFDKDFEAKRRTALELGARVPWRQRNDIAVWRGNLGCAIGCGRRGAAYFPRNYVQECTDDSPHWDTERKGFVYGCGDDKRQPRGAWMDHYRVRLVNYSATCGEVCGIDAAFPELGGEHRPFVLSYHVNLSRWEKGYVSDEQQAAHRYIFHVGNNGYADRSWRMFALGAVVLIVENGWREFFWPFLKPFVHYIPVNEDSSDACEKLRWARAHPEEAEAIAARGRAFAEHCLTVGFVNLYTAEVMRQLGALWAKGHNRTL